MTDEPKDDSTDDEPGGPSRVDPAELVRRTEDLARRHPHPPGSRSVPQSDEQFLASQGIDPKLIEDQRARDAVERWIEFAPPVYVDATLDWPAMPPEVRGPLIEWAHDVEGHTNLLVGGPVGSGKTCAVMAAAEPRVAAGLRCEYWTAFKALMELRPGDGNRDVYGRLFMADLLIIDDVGVERPSAWTMEQLAGVIDLRWQEHRTTVVTTNLAFVVDDGSPPPLMEWLGERAFSRLVGADALVLMMSGDDQRRKRADT